MDFTRCLNIPTTDILDSFSDKDCISGRCLFVSENQFIYQAGNTLQITKLPMSNSSKESRNEIISQLKNSRCNDNAVGPVFAEAKLGRGFASICYNNCRKRVAYSPRSTKPSIFVKALEDRKLLCKVDNGVKLEYADLSFNRSGSKLAAIGKDEIDAVLFVWSIELTHSKAETMDRENNYPYSPVLMARYELNYSVVKCDFNLINDNIISLVHFDATSISICQLSPFIDQWKVEEKIYNLSNNDHYSDDEEIDKTRITTVAWENQHQMLVGTSTGTIHILKDSAQIMNTFISSNTMQAHGAVKSILILVSFIIVAFAHGKVVLVKRQEQDDTKKMISITREIFVHDEIKQVHCDPAFKKMFIFTQSGDLLTYLVNDSGNCDEIKPIVNIHSCIISSLATLVMTGKASVSLLITGGADGKVKVMRESHLSRESYTLQSTIACLDIGSPITAIETLQGYPVCAIGSADGCLSFVYIGRRKESTNETFSNTIPVDMIVLKSEVLSMDPITSLAFSTESKKVVAGCYRSGQAFIICAEPTNLHVLGVIETPDKSPLCTSCWCTQNPAQILIGSQSGKISCFDTTTMCFSPEPLLPLWECSLDLPYPVQGMAMIDGNRKTSVYISYAGLKGFEAFDVTFQNNISNTEKKLTQHCFHKSCCCIIIRGQMLIVGSASGEVAIFERDSDNIRLMFKKNVHVGYFLAATLSSDKSRLYSSSLDGTLFAHSIGVPVPIVQSAYEYDYLIPKNPQRKKVALEALDKLIRDNGGRRKTWLCKAKARQDGEEQVESANTKRVIQKKIEKVRTQLQKLLDDNENNDEMEKLNVEEFVIDIQENELQKRKLASIVNKHIDKIKSEFDCHKQTVDEMKQEYFESMLLKFQSINEITTGLSSQSVSNVPLHHMDSQYQRALEIVRLLRCNEISEMKRNLDNASNDSKSWTTHSFILNGTNLNLLYDNSANGKLPGANDRGGSVLDSNTRIKVKDGGSPEVHHLLYPASAVRTKCQKISQLYLLRQSRRDMIVSFNGKFVQVQVDKQNSISQIKSALCRIEELTHAKKSDNHHYNLEMEEDISLENFELKATTLSNDSSLKDEKSSTMSPTRERALIDMMGRSLNTDVRINTMEHKSEEEKEKLASEVKRLETSIQSIVSTFNTDLAELQHQRHILMRDIYANELYQLILIHFVFQNEDKEYDIAQLKLRKQLETDVLKRDITADLKKVSCAHERLRNDMLQQLKEDKLLEKTFRKRIQQVNGGVIDQETLNLLHQMFQRRISKRPPKKSSKLNMSQNIPKKKNVMVNNARSIQSLTRRSKIGRQSGRNSSSYIGESHDMMKNNGIRSQNSNNIVKMNIALAMKEVQEDEYSELEDCMSGNNESFNDEYSKGNNDTNYEEVGTDQIPEGFVIAETVWNSMQQFRREKIQKELYVEKSKAIVKETKSLLENVETNRSNVLETIKDIDSKVEALQLELEVESPHLLLLIQQGKNEVKESCLSSIYQNASIIASSRIKEIHTEISERSNSKHTLFSKRRKLQQAINNLQWKQELLQLQEYHEKELYIDFQFMHLSSELRMLLNGEKVMDTTPNLNDQLARHKSAFDAKMSKLLIEQKALAKSIKERQKENSKLRSQLESLNHTVQEKEKRYQNIIHPQNKKNPHITKIMHRSKLMNTVRNQGNDIAKMRSHLDTLRQKTFPSFLDK